MAALKRNIDGKEVEIILTDYEMLLIGQEYLDDRADTDIQIFLESGKCEKISDRDMQLIKDDFKNQIENCVMYEKKEWLEEICEKRIGKKVNAFG